MKSFSKNQVVHLQFEFTCCLGRQVEKAVNSKPKTKNRLCLPRSSLLAPVLLAVGLLPFIVQGF